MRLPKIHMSTGAWIFATGVAISVIVSGGVYATANSIFAIGNSTGTTTAYVTPTRQLQTVTIAPANVVQFGTSTLAALSSCQAVYTPPAGKAIVVTQVTYTFGESNPGTPTGVVLTNAACTGNYDSVATAQLFDSKSHTFPTGMPMAGIGLNSIISPADVFVSFTGYLIPASELPSRSPGKP